MTLNTLKEEWLGIYLQKRLLIIALLGFSSGIPLFLTSSTLSIWLKELGYDYTTIGFFALASLPYSLRFVWAPFIDRLPLPYLTGTFGRRRGWLILSQVSLMICLVMFWVLGPSLQLAFITTLTAATQEMLMLTYQMESLEKSQYGPGDAIGVFGARMGMIVSGAGAIYLSTLMPWGLVYTIMALCVAVGLFTTLMIKEPEIMVTKETLQQEKKISQYLDNNRHIPESLSKVLSWIYAAIVCPFSDFLRSKGWLAALGIMFFYKFGDNLIGAMPNIMYLELGFTKPEIARATKLFGMIASIFGGLLGGILVTRIGFVRSMLHFGIFHMLATFMYIVTFYAGHNLWVLYLAIALEHVTAGMRTTALFAYQLTLCNPVYAATQLALLTSLVCLGRTIFGTLSGLTVESVGWVQFYSLAIMGSLPALMICVHLLRLQNESVFGNRAVQSL